VLLLVARILSSKVA